jgi:hypothetical protein
VNWFTTSQSLCDQTDGASRQFAVGSDVFHLDAIGQVLVQAPVLFQKHGQLGLQHPTHDFLPGFAGQPRIQPIDRILEALDQHDIFVALAFAVLPIRADLVPIRAGIAQSAKLVEQRFFKLGFGEEGGHTGGSDLEERAEKVHTDFLKSVVFK